MRASLITSGEEFARVGGWSELAGRVGKPFQSPEWLTAWWEAFGTGCLRCAVVRSEQRLLGLLACYVLDEPSGRKLLPVGAGVSDHLDALVDPEAPSETASTLLAAVLQDAPVTCCDLIDLPPGAVLRRAAVPAGWNDTVADTVTCPVLVFPEHARDLRQAIPARMHRKLRMSRHRAERRGGAVHLIAEQQELGAAVERLAGLHAARWEERGEPGVFGDARVLECVTRAAPGLAARGLLEVHLLRFGDDVVAACLALPAGRDLMLYLSGFDAAYAFESPGTILLGEIAEAALAERRTLHFLRGGESYKYAWGAVDRFNAVRRLTRR